MRNMVRVSILIGLVGGAVILLLLWNGLVWGDAKIQGMYDWEMVVLIATGLSALVVVYRPEEASWLGPVMVFAPVISASRALPFMLPIENWSYGTFLVVHFGLPAIIVASLTLWLLGRDLSKHWHLGAVVLTVVIGEMIAQLVVNPLLFIGVAQRFGWMQVEQHIAGVHELWPRQFMAVTLGAVVGGIGSILMLRRSRPQVSGKLSLGVLITVVVLVTAYVAMGAVDRCGVCLERLGDYVVVGSLLLISAIVLSHKLSRIRIVNG